MAGYADREISFSDDDLDDLPPDALAELENNAIQFTQAAANTQAPRAVPPSSNYGDDFDDEDLDDAVVIDEARSAPAIMPALHRNKISQLSQREPFRQQPPYGGNSSQGNRRLDGLNQPNRDRLPRPTAAPPQMAPIATRQGSQSQTTGEAAALRKQLEQMRKELATIKQDNNAKTGEVAIVRSQLEKQTRERERERAALQKINEERLLQQRKELEAARVAGESAATERDFIKQDLLEVQRAQKVNKTVEKKDIGVITPKKKKALPHRDGFDDDEVEILSPSKLSPSKFKRRIGTPTKAGKRKRKAAESPIAPLEVIQTEDQPLQELDYILPPPGEVPISRLEVQDDRFDFLGTMLDHRPDRDHLRSIEALGKYALPSAPTESFESVILGKIPVLGQSKPATDLPIEFCELLISLWTNCLDEKYHTPIYLFIDMLTLALELKTLAISPHIIKTLVPIAQRTADLVAIPRFGLRPPEQYDKDINPGSCLAILYIAALGCVPETAHIKHFWRLLRWDFVLLILSTNQPTSDFEMMLNILSTSVFRDTFGTITPDDPTAQQDNARFIIDRLTYPLYEIPYMPMSTDKLPTEALQHLRLEILHLLLSAVARSPYASQALAAHRTAVGRLVSLMSDELDVLYDYRAGHGTSSLILTLATRLLYHLVTSHELDMQSKLAPILGGSQKYLLVLSRLNFAEDDLLLESGVEMDVQGLVLEMLNLRVTPEEVDAVNGAFAGCLRE